MGQEYPYEVSCNGGQPQQITARGPVHAVKQGSRIFGVPKGAVEITALPRPSSRSHRQPSAGAYRGRPSSTEIERRIGAVVDGKKRSRQKSQAASSKPGNGKHKR